MTYNDDVIKMISQATGTTYSDEQLAILRHNGGMCISACAGAGKALKNGTGVLTPRGYIAIEELKIGDLVYSQDGKAYPVIGVYPQGKKRVYKMHLSDRTIIECCEDHIWVYQTEGMRINNKWNTATTSEILKMLNTGNIGKLYIPITEPVEFDSGTINSDMKDFIDNLSNCELISDKHKFSTISDRRAILESVIEAYGKCDESGYNLNLPSAKIADHIKFICETLGIVVVRNSSNNLHLNNASENREITYIDETDEYAEMTCIMVDSPDHTFLTENCVVTHNTTVLTHLIAKRIKTGEITNPSKLLLTTFSKAGAQEMETRLNALLNQINIKQTVTVKTLHAFFWYVIRTITHDNRRVMSNTEKYNIIRKACNELEILREEDDRITLENLLSFQINNMLSDEALTKSYAYTLKNTLSLEDYSRVRTLVSKKKDEQGLIDYDDMQMIMLTLLKGPNGQAVQDYCRYNWQYIYIDEAQDISRIQYTILKHLISSPDRLAMIGDDDQCIYQWRGADPSLILNVCGDYGIPRFNLTTNYRCHGDIVRHAATGIKFNTIRTEKTMEPANEGGRIQVCDVDSTNLYTMTKCAFNYIKSLIVDKGVSPDDIAVLSRNNKHQYILGNMLFKDGIYIKLASDILFTKSPQYKKIKGLIELCQDTNNAGLTKSQLYWPAAFLRKDLALQISKLQETLSIKLSDAIGYIAEYIGNERIGYTGQLRVPPSAIGSLQYAWNRASYDTRASLVNIYNILIQPDIGERVCAMLDLVVLNNRIPDADQTRTTVGICEYVKDLIRSMGMAEYLRFMSIAENYEGGNLAVLSPQVTLSTIHSAKGKEWKYVILFADDNISMPNLSSINNNTFEGMSFSDIQILIDEGRRLHYVAMTRAKVELTIFSDWKNPGIYLLESFGIYDFGIHNDFNIVNHAQSGIPRDIIDKAVEVIFGNDQLRLDIK